MEVWNNVFSQFNNDGQGNYTELVQKNIDTGMGLERLAVVVQDVDSLFDVDTVRNITKHVTEISGKTYGESYKTDVSLRVITDHIRSTTMMVCDGVMPSNEGRGYVLRRLLRRAARHGKLLGIDRPFLYEVCDTVIRESGGAYPALVEKQEYIRKVIRVEEERFDATIDNGLKILNEMIEEAKQSGATELSSENAFKLYDTYGFPIDLTLEIIEEQGLTTDLDGFNALMQQQKETARADRKRMGDVGWASDDLGLDKSIQTEFVGYDNLEAEGKVLALIAGDEVSGSAPKGNKVIVVLDQTSFYAESGGQVPDYGTLTCGDCTVSINNVQKTADKKFLHYGVVESGTLNVGDTVVCHVDLARRQAVSRSHTATHLLQKALRMVLGTHVEQAGSYTDADHVRFDFTHFAALTNEEIAKVEQIANNAVLAGIPVNVQEMPIDEAKKLGAMALFGEKYGDIVRVVQAGDFSIEFCGGTHLDNTAKVGLIKVISESSVAAGVRRLEAVTGQGFLELCQQRQNLVDEAASILKTNPNELLSRAEQLLAEIKENAKSIDKLNSKIANMQMVNMLNMTHDINGVDVLAVALEDVTPDIMRSMGDALRDQKPNIAAVLATVPSEDKILFNCVVGKEAVKKGAHAGKIIREVAKMTGGGGGGRPDSASAGGKNPAKLEEALEAVNNIVAGMLKA
ncbi:MAG: alanine--tRNA ligase, partial [Butyricicoccaceae bacterium]